ncbi:hypothetical protein F6X40_10105 [Paraburkholderia sp. UCT31]|uniref:hypothetical protein n=1 Tax=Paraburkholderia sp. UCT31 TaxID=2615209 RepID=UPI0016553775|nr:hypothetical protein [Paraburkholderia sp. UCT31]MBC8737160.1 hypothetical protein [Paraburkholderia sp. UCT31]
MAESPNFPLGGRTPEEVAQDVQRRHSIETRIRAILKDMDNWPELAEALARSHEETRAAITNPTAIDPGTPPELLELLKKDPFALSRFC